MRKKMRLDLADSVERDGHHDKKRCATEIERHRILADQDFGKQADKGQVCRAKNR